MSLDTCLTEYTISNIESLFVQIISTGYYIYFLFFEKQIYILFVDYAVVHYEN